MQQLIDQKIKDMVQFKYVNLIEPFSMRGGFDMIFCRNVLIYFDDETKSRIFDQFHQMLSDPGFLMLGATENTYNITNKFDSRQQGKTIIYMKSNSE
jgi:chemotaxis protein methyltransferase CheR